ncbi:MAG: hypothetical protein RLY71_3866 [Pseudomonadota bacterium]|jgi:hypothetical protein
MLTQDSEFLEQRPEARAMRVEDLVRDMRRGRLRIPTFQRPFLWKREDARKLIDSIYRGYPVGNLLLWERRAEAAQQQLGAGLHIQAEAREDAWWVVDGQQRLVSLARVLLMPEGVSDDFALDIDLDERRVVPSIESRTRAADPTRWLPLNRVVDSEHLVAWLVAMQPGALRQQRAIQAGKRLREYDVPVYIVRTGHDAVLREIFGRINASGKPLEVHEVFEALNSGRHGTQPDSLSAMADALSSWRFGHLDESLIYRALRVVQGQDIVESGREQPKRMPDAAAAEALVRTQQALTAVIQFLTEDAGIPHVRVLPYKEPVVTLAKFFHFHPRPNARSRQLLARWVWRGALNGSHQGNTVSTRSALALVEAADEEGSVQRLLQRVGRQRPELPPVAQRFNFRHAAAKLQVLALLELRPRDLASGEPIDAAAWLEQQGGQDPDATVPPMIVPGGGGSEPWRTSLANRLIQGSGSRLRERLMGEGVGADILHSHGVTDAAVAALRRGDSLEFLRLRAEALDVWLAQSFSRHARWDETDRPSLASLTLADED